MNEKTENKNYQELKGECAPIFYKELEVFFAKGMLVLVDDDMDIINVALAMQNDDSIKLKKWSQKKLVTRVNDTHAITWSKTNEPLMAVTVVPWVLVQEIKPK